MKLLNMLRHGDKSTPQYQLNAAFNEGYKKALDDLATFIKAMGV